MIRLFAQVLENVHHLLQQVVHALLPLPLSQVAEMAAIFCIAIAAAILSQKKVRPGWKKGRLPLEELSFMQRCVPWLFVGAFLWTGVMVLSFAWPL